MKSKQRETREKTPRLPGRTQIEMTEINIEAEQASAVIYGVGSQPGKIVQQLSVQHSTFWTAIQRLPVSRFSGGVFTIPVESIPGKINNWDMNENLAVVVWDSENWLSTRAAQSLVQTYIDFGIATLTLDIRGRVLPGAGGNTITIMLPQISDLDVCRYLTDYLLGILPSVISDTWIVLDFSKGRTPLMAGEMSWCTTGRGELPDGATQAITDALSKIEAQGFSLENAKAVLLAYNIFPSISVNETWVGAEHLKSALPEGCQLLYALSTDPTLENTIEATLIVSQELN